MDSSLLVSAATATVALGVAFLIGAVPFAYIIGRLVKGIDIREHGSGNVGGTNAIRVLGYGPGFAVIALDITKGAVAVLAARGAVVLAAGLFDVVLLPVGVVPWLPVMSALAAVLGHTYTPFLAFRGGKGIATGAGSLLAITPWSIVILIAVFLAVIFLTRMVSAGSVTVAALYPLSVWLMYREVPGAFPLALVMAAVVIWRHRSNIGRILKGEERRVNWGLGARRSEGEGR